MPSLFKTVAFVCLFGLLLTGPLSFTALHAAIFFDDFNDGNISGWTTYNPFGNLAITYPGDNSVRLAAGASPNLNFGPGRTVIYRNDLPQTNDFTLTVDFSAYDDTNNFFGLLARTRQIGAGTLDGYLVTYSPQWYTNPLTPHARFAIDRLDNEVPTQLIEEQFNTLDGNGNYQLRLTTFGSLLTADLFDLSNPLVPLFTISADDGNYLDGLVGLAAIGSQVNNVTALATFDNFSLQAVPEPGTWALILGGMLALARLKKSRKA